MQKIYETWEMRATFWVEIVIQWDEETLEVIILH